MSRPLAWNGSAWVDPSFHIGGGIYKKYVPASYDVDADNYLFDANNQGWTMEDPQDYGGNTRPASWTGGYIYARTPGGLLSAMLLTMPDPTGTLQPGIKIAARYVWSTVKVGATAVSDIKVAFDAPGYYGGEAEEKVLASQANGQQTYTTKATYTTTGDGQERPRLKMSINDGELTTGQSTELRIHSAVLINSATGQPLKQLGNVPWEPKVFRSSGKWV